MSPDDRIKATQNLSIFWNFAGAINPDHLIERKVFNEPRRLSIILKLLLTFHWSYLIKWNVFDEPSSWQWRLNPLAGRDLTGVHCEILKHDFDEPGIQMRFGWEDPKHALCRIGLKSIQKFKLHYLIKWKVFNEPRSPISKRTRSQI